VETESDRVKRVTKLLMENLVLEAMHCENAPREGKPDDEESD
jgi:hypothetical protein